MQKEQLDTKPWYKQFWPWFIIALPLSAVIASFATLVIAIEHPVQLVVKDDKYRQIRAELKPTVGHKNIDQTLPAKKKPQH